MRSRLLDVVLIAGLVVVAGGIMWTLFNLGSGSGTAATPPTSGATVAGTATGGTTITPLTPSEVVPTDVVPSDVAPALSGTPTATGATAPGADPTGAPSEARAAPRVVPAGAVALERVGFSYVTGGAGACSVVLEAWVHVAVSRDLLATYGCGAEVLVTLDDEAGGRTQVLGVIGDTMNPSFERTVNVYVGTDEPALAYGLTTGSFSPR